MVAIQAWRQAWILGCYSWVMRKRTTIVVGGCYPSMETSMDLGVLLMGCSETEAVMVAGGCYPGMETSMDYGVLPMVYSREKVVGGCYLCMETSMGFGVLLIGYQTENGNGHGGRWLLSRNGGKHGFSGVAHGFIREREAVIVVGGCYPGMETSMDFGVLFMVTFQSWRQA